MSQYKLTYFNVRGRAEAARLVFAAAGVKYEDIRIDNTKWPEMKPTTPYGGLPILEVDGVKLCQSIIIARFLANRFGLAGKTDIEKAQADMIVDCMHEIIKPSAECRFEKDEARKKEMTDKFVNETLPTLLGMLEKLLKENKGGDGYFVGDSLTWADLGLVDMCSWIEAGEITLPFDKAPKLKALRARVESLPKIAEWIKNRPVTPM